MAIEKIIRVENIGRFADLAAKGDVAFRSLTLLYGPNGHGKTTIAGIFRSLATGDPAYINERATLGGATGPYAELRVSSKSAVFQSGSWNFTAPEIEIFDDTFVSDNVYTGEHVDPEHRKHLYEVVVGTAAVSLARRVNEIDFQTRGLSAKISSTEENLRRFIQAPFDLDRFLTLGPEEALEAKIRDVTTTLNAVRKSKDVLARGGPQGLILPQIPRKILDVLKTAAKHISQTAEDRVRQHIQMRLDHRGEQWLRQGLEYVRSDRRCPFCTQPTDTTEIVALYSDYFSATYRDYIVAIEQAINDLDQNLGDQALRALQKRVLENDAIIKGWSDLANLDYAKFDIDRIEHPWLRLRSLLAEELKRKLSNPSEAASNDERVEAALRNLAEATSLLNETNAAIDRANNQIAGLKKQAAATGEGEIEQELRMLRNTQIRQQPEVATLCEALLQARSEKRALEEEKKLTRKKLEELAANVLSKYEAGINRLLKDFGASFSITGTKPSFSGGKASSTYRISINNTAMDLGDSSTPRGTPCFRTLLSAGDKSTLALAFFLARLDQDTEVGKKIVVFDDPLSSLDCFRISCTQQEISRATRRAAQVVVLSHDAFFLHRIFESSDKSTTKALQVIREGKTYSVREWDSAKYCLAEAHQDYFVLRSYIEEGAPDGADVRAVARAIRPYVEGHLRHRFPDSFPPAEWLGDFIGRIDNADASSKISSLKPKLEELNALNDYAKKFHHAPGQPMPAVPDDTELRTFAERAIAFVQSG